LKKNHEEERTELKGGGAPPYSTSWDRSRTKNFTRGKGIRKDSKVRWAGERKVRTCVAQIMFPSLKNRLRMAVEGGANAENLRNRSLPRDARGGGHGCSAPECQTRVPDMRKKKSRGRVQENSAAPGKEGAPDVGEANRPPGKGDRRGRKQQEGEELLRQGLWHQGDTPKNL